MAKRNYTYSKNEDYLVRTVGTITKITELNKEYKNNFKCVFSISIPQVEDKRFDTGISWQRWIIAVGDLITIKGRYLENGFLVKELRILRKAETKENTAQEELNGKIPDTA